MIRSLVTLYAALGISWFVVALAFVVVLRQALR